MHGYGVYMWAKTNPIHGKYQGELKDGKKWGRGKEVWKNGQAYQGTFVDGLKSGFGIMEFEDKSDYDIYMGEFKEDDLWGYGTLKWKNGDVYRGEFDSGYMHGYGEITWAKNSSEKPETPGLKEAEKYTGQFHDGLLNGYGILVFSNKSLLKKFEGFFANNTISHVGTLWMKNGDKFIGEAIAQHLP